jgi:hypothetical protein
MKRLIERWKAPINDFWKDVIKWSAIMLVPCVTALGAIKVNGITSMPQIETILGYAIVILTTLAGSAKMTKK